MVWSLVEHLDAMKAVELVEYLVGKMDGEWVVSMAELRAEPKVESMAAYLVEQLVETKDGEWVVMKAVWMVETKVLNSAEHLVWKKAAW
jgi:hypothetical protein